MLRLRDKRGRDLAILGASWLDVVLEQNLIANMGALSAKDREELFGGRGVLSTTSAKIRVAHSFKLISEETKSQSLLLNRVRNEFAHTLEDLNATSPRILHLLDQMSLTPEHGLEFITINPDAPTELEHDAFLFDGERFEIDDVNAILDLDPERVLFFLPSGDGTSPDAVLLRHVYACIFGVAGLGLRSWVERTSLGGLGEMTH
ncbi:hypothetical protein C3E77_01890 [Mycetocola zhujimingii]|nr:hypothetical protein C3E77_01890 [Mycetocola zhujimingii]